MTNVERTYSIYGYKDATLQELVITLPIVTDTGRSDCGSELRRSTDDEVIQSAPMLTGLPIEEAQLLHYVVKDL